MHQETGRAPTTAHALKTNHRGSCAPSIVRTIRTVFMALCAAIILVMSPYKAFAQPRAWIAMDMRDGKVYASHNADQRLYPASLTKIMTLYLTFEAVESGKIDLDQKVTISRRAASMPASHLGMRPGQRISIRYLIRAAAIKSANDAAVALGEAVDGSESAFVAHMNRKAKKFGMTRTTFRNTNGLPNSEHKSTVRDMAKLARHMYFDFPQYYHLFSKTSVHIGRTRLLNTNRLFLNYYRGATGLKTGYTHAAGYNLAATAKHGSRVGLVVIFKASNSLRRARKASKLMNTVMRRSPVHVSVRKPRQVAIGPPKASPRPPSKPIIAGALMAALEADQKPSKSAEVPDISNQIAAALEPTSSGGTQVQPRPSDAANVHADLAPKTSIKPSRRPALVTAAAKSRNAMGEASKIVDLGGFTTRFTANKVLVRIGLMEPRLLGPLKREVQHTPTAWRPVFVGLTAHDADLVCHRLQQRGETCRVRDF